MLSQTDAEVLVKNFVPERRVEFYLDYKDLYLFLGFDDSDPDEGAYDPYYSVSKETGEVAEFPAVAPRVRVELTNLWAQQNGITLPS